MYRLAIRFDNSPARPARFLRGLPFESRPSRFLLALAFSALIGYLILCRYSTHPVKGTNQLVRPVATALHCLLGGSAVGVLRVCFLVE